MGFALISFLVVMTILAALTQDSFVFTLVYVIAGAYLFGNWWNNRIIRSVDFHRVFTDHAFPGDKVDVRLKIFNASRLPAVWLHLHELLPLEIAAARNLQEVVTLTGHQEHTIKYSLAPKRRGYYPVGPFRFASGDLLGFSKEKETEIAPDFLTVYPEVIPLTRVGIPSHSPLGNLKHNQPVFEDPSRPIAKREYLPGDSLRRIDWKATAAAGRLQVKQFEPSIALETIVFLNLNLREYPIKSRYPDTELSISVAASLANWIISRKQAVGLVTNGKDILATMTTSQVIQARKGRGHLMRLLESMARVEAVETEPFSALLHQHCYELSWGTTLMLVTSQANKDLFHEMVQARKMGLDSIVILCGEIAYLQEIKSRASHFHIPLFILRDEKDFKIWQRAP